MSSVANQWLVMLKMHLAAIHFKQVPIHGPIGELQAIISPAARFAEFHALPEHGNAQRSKHEGGVKFIPLNGVRRRNPLKRNHFKNERLFVVVDVHVHRLSAISVPSGSGWCVI